MKTSELINTPVQHPPNGTVCRIADLVFDTESSRIPAALLQRAEPAPVQLGVFPLSDLAPDGAGGVILDIPEAELHALEETAEADAPDAPVDLGHIPPLFTGPFGYTIAPALVAARINLGLAPEPERPAMGDEFGPGAFWVSRLLGLPVFTASGELGRLSDMTFAHQTGALTAMEVTAEDGACQTIPGRLFRYVAKDGTSIVVRGDGAPAYAFERDGPQMTDLFAATKP